MKVLLIGDYSGVHLNLFTALRQLGHEAALISTGDGDKKIPTHLRWVTKSSSRFSKIFGLHGASFVSDNANVLDCLCDFDVVQFINPIFVEEASPCDNWRLFKQIKERNGKVYLYSCGDDFNWVFSSVMRKGSVSMFKNPGLYISKELYHPARYVLDPRIVELCKSIYSAVDGIIPGSLDYDWCLKGRGNVRNVIPFPVDIDLFSYEARKIRARPVVLHGVQAGKRIRKGDAFFERASSALEGQVNYKKIGGLPFLEYIRQVGNCDIFLDQVYSESQGMSALFAMACGRVVFSGFSERFRDYYQLTEAVGVDANPSVSAIRSRLVELITGELNAEEIGYAARRFVERVHGKIAVAEKFMLEWGR